MKKIKTNRTMVLGAILTVSVLLLSACRKDFKSDATQLTLWTTNEDNARSYTQLTELWNAENPQKTIELNVSVYNAERIEGKLDSVFSKGTLFASNELPDLVDIGIDTFRNYVFLQSTELYPLQNVLESNCVSSLSLSCAETFSHNGICFALPYNDTQAVFCYRLALLRDYPDFLQRVQDTEGLEALAQEYRTKTGSALIRVDYFGNEFFLASLLPHTALMDEEKAESETIRYLSALNEQGLSAPMESGNAYNDAFVRAIKEEEIPCFVTTAGNLLSLAAAYPEVVQQYGITCISCSVGEARIVQLPGMATAIPISNENTTLARDFLAFTRFSSAAQDFPSLYLNETTFKTDDRLEAVFGVRPFGVGDTDAPIFMNEDSAFFETIGTYAQTVLE